MTLYTEDPMPAATATKNTSSTHAMASVRGGRLAATAIAVYLAGRMFYVFPSGLPQPWDLGMAAGFAVLVRPQHVQRTLQSYRGYALLLAVIVVVNGAWGLLRWKPTYLFPIAFHVFNLLLLTTVMTARIRNPVTFDNLVAKAATLAAYGQVAYCTLIERRQFRAKGTLNNENQLAYWALCMMGIFLLCKKERNLRDLPIVAALVWVELLSTSRAGVVAMGMLVALWGWDILIRSRHRYVYGAMLAVVLALGSASSAVETYQNELTVTDHLVNRFSKDSSADEVGLRNTDRISHYPQYAIFGAGEGDLERFPYSLPIEIHSVPMTILFSYGILGTVGATWAMIVLWRRLDWKSRIIVLALFIYSITHNGMRFAFCWVLLGCITAEAVLARRQSPMASSIAALTRRTSKRSSTKAALPSP
jgi:hypothetical protein